jgi:hypothetical protein
MGQVTSPIAAAAVTSSGNAIVSVISSNASNQDIFGSGRVMVLLASKVFNWPANLVRVTLTGSAGSGAAAVGPTARATGGAGGGYARAVLSVTKGAPVVITIGVGGAPVAAQSAGESSTGVNGNPGTSSSVGSLITVTGGAGGKFGHSVAVAGAIGGIAVGGEVNTNGGNSGSICESAFVAATGGSAPGNEFGVGGDSGALRTVIGTATATGGGGIYPSADANATFVATGGGGTTGPSTTKSPAGGPDILGNTSMAAGSINPTEIPLRCLGDALTGSAGAGTTSVNGFPGGPGAGGGAVAAPTGIVRSGDGGINAGSGAAVAGAISGGVVTSGNGGLGGASGGAVANTSGVATSGKAGDAWVKIEW